MEFWDFGQVAMNANFLDFLKLFEAVDVDGSFPMRRYT